MKPSGCRETVGRLHLFHAIRVHVAIVRDSFTPACSYYVMSICWLVTIVRDSFTPSCGYYVIPFVGSLPYSAVHTVSLLCRVYRECSPDCNNCDDTCPGGSPPVSMMPVAVLPLSVSGHACRHSSACHAAVSLWLCAGWARFSVSQP